MQAETLDFMFSGGRFRKAGFERLAELLLEAVGIQLCRGKHLLCGRNGEAVLLEKLDEPAVETCGLTILETIVMGTENGFPCPIGRKVAHPLDFLDCLLDRERADVLLIPFLLLFLSRAVDVRKLVKARFLQTHVLIRIDIGEVIPLGWEIAEVEDFPKRDFLIYLRGGLDPIHGEHRMDVSGKLLGKAEPASLVIIEIRTNTQNEALADIAHIETSEGFLAIFPLDVDMIAEELGRGMAGIWEDARETAEIRILRSIRGLVRSRHKERLVIREQFLDEFPIIISSFIVWHRQFPFG